MGWDSNGWKAVEDPWSSGGGNDGKNWWESAEGGAATNWWESGNDTKADPWGAGAAAQPAAEDSWNQSGGQDDWKKSAGGWDSWGNADPSQWAENLKTVDWHGVQLVKIEKNFYDEHPDVKNRTAEEVAALRRQHDIEVLGGDGHGGDIPNPVSTFQEAAFPDWLLECVQRKGFQAPTPIQIQVWPVALQGRDLIGIAETGSGKTLAYLLPMMIHIIAQDELRAGEGPVGLVLCPTRELALQINGVAEEYFGLSGLKSTCVYGGVPVKEQGYAVQQKNDIVVATPGRFIQLLNDQWTNLNRVTYVVLDEADEMLDKGFGDQIKLILSQVRPDRQMLMFSATWGSGVQEIAKTYCTASDGMDPVMIRVGGDRLAACRTIQQNVLVLEAGVDKFDKLREAIVRSQCDKKGSPHKCLIFCKTKANVDELVGRLNSVGIQINGLHSDKDQRERIWMLEQFRNGEMTCLAATQCLGRGHDIPRVKYVINYDAPDNIEAYIHRIGRTGRAGESGFAMTFLTNKDGKLAVPLVEVLKRTDQKVTPKVQTLATDFQKESPWAGNEMEEFDKWNDQGGGSGAAASWDGNTQ